MYHGKRVLYELAGEKDLEPFIRIHYNIRVQRDPMFVLIRTAAMLQLGYGPERIESELSNFNSATSPVVKTYSLAVWWTRLGIRVRRQAKPSIN